MFESQDDDHVSSDGDSDCAEDFPPRPQYQDPCYRCKKRVYPVERVDVGVLFHRFVSLYNCDRACGYWRPSNVSRTQLKSSNRCACGPRGKGGGLLRLGDGAG